MLNKNWILVQMLKDHPHWQHYDGSICDWHSVTEGPCFTLNLLFVSSFFHLFVSLTLILVAKFGPWNGAGLWLAPRSGEQQVALGCRCVEHEVLRKRVHNNYRKLNIRGSLGRGAALHRGNILFSHPHPAALGLILGVQEKILQCFFALRDLLFITTVHISHVW